MDTLKGEDGKEIELDNNGVYIRWRYVGESWVNLITLSSLKGNDGADGMALESAYDVEISEGSDDTVKKQFYQCKTVQEIADFLTELVIKAKENKWVMM